MIEKKKKRRIVKISLIILSIFIIFLGGTYAFIHLTLTGNKKQVITVGNLELELDEYGNNLTLTSAMPISDGVGMIQKDEFTFRLINKTKNPTNYILKLIETEESKAKPKEEKLETSVIKYGLIKNQEPSIHLISEIEKMDNSIDEGTIQSNETIEYSLRLWLDSDIDSNDEFKDKSFSCKIEVEATPNNVFRADYGIDKSNANPPKLANGLIPVIYNDIDKKWIVADSSNQQKYYNYDKQIWANAVTVPENVRNLYLDDLGNIQKEAIGKDITNDITTMFVWIPRYSYTIQMKTVGVKKYYGKKEEGRESDPLQSSPGEIDVKFIKEEELEQEAGTYTEDNGQEGTWRTPDGFTFDKNQLAGFWIAKFELTGTLSKTCVTTEVCDVSELTIKPNNVSIRSQKISNFFHAVKSMQQEGNPFGFETDQTKMDIHMIKNSEWGTATYLAQSKYGKYGNKNYEETEKEVKINNCSEFITGIGATTKKAEASESVCTNPDNQYDGIYGMSASTTGNITGVYDMSGGSYESVMGVLADEEGHPRSGNTTKSNSGFNGKLKDETLNSSGFTLPEEKYYDLYKGTDFTTACNEGVCFGHALSETKGWYGNLGGFVSLGSPWTYRGNYNGGKGSVGIFYSSGYSGGGVNTVSTRAVAVTF